MEQNENKDNDSYKLIFTLSLIMLAIFVAILYGELNMVQDRFTRISDRIIKIESR